MAKNQFNIFEDDAKKMMDGLRKQYEKGFSADMDRAAEILQQEYFRFLREAASKGISGILGETNVVVKYKRKFKGVPRSIKVFVPDNSEEEGDLIFNILNSGRKALGDARAYGLKVWPMHEPRQVKFGNNPLTKANSPQLQTAYSGQPVIYRRFSNKPVAPRNFVKFILEKAQKRLEEEGLDYIDIKLSEQD